MKKNTKRDLLGCTMDSPVGALTLLATPRGIAGIYFEERCLEDWQAGDSALLRQAEAELAEYFAGQRREFTLPLDVVGTDFQRSVWKALEEVGYGERASYGEIAERIGNPKAVRAVGLANGANPTSIIVPCHRVIGANGSLTGYGGGLERKRLLLQLEEGHQATSFQLKE